jgi:hypothetical protein
MAKSVFGDLKCAVDEAGEFLRSFTLGHRGFTRSDGVAAIDRLGRLCDQMKTQFASGEHAADAAGMVAAAANQIQAAKARLKLLGGRENT